MGKGQVEGDIEQRTVGSRHVACDGGQGIEDKTWGEETGDMGKEIGDRRQRVGGGDQEAWEINRAHGIGDIRQAT